MEIEAKVAVAGVNALLGLGRQRSFKKKTPGEQVMHSRSCPEVVPPCPL